MGPREISDLIGALLEIAKQVEKQRFVLEKIYGRLETTNISLEEISQTLARSE
jgi:hypothetical protein